MAVTFNRHDWVREIRGDNQGVIVVVERIVPVEYQSSYDNPTRYPTQAIDYPTFIPDHGADPSTVEPTTHQISCVLKRQDSGEDFQCEPKPYEGGCDLASEESGLMVENWYELTMRFTIGVVDGAHTTLTFRVTAPVS